MVRSRLTLLLLPAIVLLGCSQFRVRSSHDPSTDWGRMRTYAWLPPDQAAPADQRVQDRYFDRRIRTDVASDFAARGYRPAESGQQPDFLLNYRLSSEPASVVRADPGGNWGGVWSANWMAGGAAYYTDNYDEGTLYIAALDPTSKRIVWVGLAQARLVPTMSFERKKKRFDAAVHQILQRFPNG
jgi:hypothetical protein